MRLFKVYDPYTIDEINQCLGIWAEDERKALRAMAAIQEELDLYEDPFESVISSFKVEEIYPARDCDVYFCYEKDMSHAEDVKAIFVPFDVQNVEEYIMNQLAEMDSREDFFRDYVRDKAINMSFAERFFYDEDGYMFDLSHPIKIREGLVEDEVDRLFAENVKKFFGDEIGFRDVYFDYLYSVDEPDFTDDFYHFICKRLMQLGDWGQYDIVKIDIVAD